MSLLPRLATVVVMLTSAAWGASPDAVPVGANAEGIAPACDTLAVPESGLVALVAVSADERVASTDSDGLQALVRCRIR